jgi:hypothetical protein
MYLTETECQGVELIKLTQETFQERTFWAEEVTIKVGDFSST